MITQRTPHRNIHNDAGQALPMALVFVVVIGALVVALLVQTQANFRSISTTKALQDRIAAANGGADFGIQMARRKAIVNGAVACGNSSAMTQIGTTIINGRLATVTCQMTAGALPGVGGWSAYLSGTGQTTGVATSGSSGAANVSGPLFNGASGASKWTFDSGASLQVQNGDVVQPSGCSPQSASLVIKPTPMYSCVNTSPTAPTSAQSLPAVLPAAAPAPTTNGACTVYRPGYYSSSLNLSGENFFQPGIYVLYNANINVNGKVVAGAPGAWDTQGDGSGVETEGNDQPCATPSSQNGVIFVLGGSSTIQLNLGSRLEVFGYVDPSSPTVATSVYQLRSGSTPWAAAKASTVSGSTPIIQGNGSFFGIPYGYQVAIHGAVYTPNSRVSLSNANISSLFGDYTITPVTGSALSGGVMASGLDLQASGTSSWFTNVQNFLCQLFPSSFNCVSNDTGINYAVSSDFAPADQTIKVVASVDYDTTQGFAKPISATAILTISNDALRTVSISSWSVNNA